MPDWMRKSRAKYYPMKFLFVFSLLGRDQNYLSHISQVSAMKARTEQTLLYICAHAYENNVSIKTGSSVTEMVKKLSCFSVAIYGGKASGYAHGQRDAGGGGNSKINARTALVLSQRSCCISTTFFLKD